MADLKLNLKAETVAKLRTLAKRNGRSLNQEIKSILARAAGTNDVGAQLRDWNKRLKG